jgi:hypothetical protein
MVSGEQLRWLAAVGVIAVAAWALVHRQPGPAAVPPVITRVPPDYLSPPPTANPNPSDGWFRYSTPPPNKARPS